MPAMKGSGVRKQRGIRFSDEEWEAIIHGARGAGVSVPDWIMRWVPGPKDMPDAPPDLFATAALVTEARASTALDGETQVVEDVTPVEQAGSGRHLHRFRDTGRILRHDRGRAIKERQCECGVVAEG